MDPFGARLSRDGDSGSTGRRQWWVSREKNPDKEGNEMGEGKNTKLSWGRSETAPWYHRGNTTRGTAHVAPAADPLGQGQSSYCSVQLWWTHDRR